LSTNYMNVCEVKWRQI